MKIGNLECCGIIYKIENIVNHKVYIGQTTRGFKNRYAGNNKTQPIEWVYNYHKYQNKRKLKGANYHLMKSIEKYGFDSFKVNEIFDIAFSRDELNIKEKCWISIYNSTNSNNGYNKANGGYDIHIANLKNRKYTNEQIINAKSLLANGIKISKVSDISGINLGTLHFIKELKLYKDLGEEYNNKIKIKKFYNQKDVLDYYYNVKDICKTAKHFNYTVNFIKTIVNKNENEKNGRYKICKKCGKKFLLHKYDPPNTNRKYCYMCSPSRVKNKTKKKKKYKNRNKKIISKTTNLINKEKINKLCSKYEQYICDEYIKNMSFSNIINNINIDFQVNNKMIKYILNKNNILIIPQKYNVNYITYYALYYDDTLLEVFRYKWQLIDCLVKNKICASYNIANNLIISKKDKQYFNNGFYIKTINKDYFNSNYCLYKNKNDKYEIEYRKRLKLDLK